MKTKNIIKRFTALLLLLVLAFTLCACKNEIDDDDDDEKPRKNPIVTKAVEKLEDHWRELYSEDNYGNGYFEIKNTRLITMKENDIEYFKDIQYIVELVLFTDLYGTAPYYQNTTRESSIIIYKDGTTMVSNGNIITNYVAKTFDTNFSVFIESVKDYDDAYNCVKKLK